MDYSTKACLEVFLPSFAARLQVDFNCSLNCGNGVIWNPSPISTKTLVCGGGGVGNCKI